MTTSEQHAEALRSYKEAGERLMQAEGACARSRDFVVRLEAQRAEFADIDDLAAAHVAAAIGGEEPSLRLPVDIQARIDARADLEAGISLARRAAAVNEDLRQTAEAETRVARESLQEKAAALLSVDALADLERLREAEREATELRARLRGFCAVDQFTSSGRKFMPAARAIADYLARPLPGALINEINSPEFIRTREAEAEFRKKFEALVTPPSEESQCDAEQVLDAA
jgi:hypothetical protein